MQKPAEHVRDGRLPDHVVFVCANYFPRVTGVGVALEGWALRLAAHGIQATVVAPHYPDCACYPQHTPPSCLNVVRLPSRPIPFAPGLRVMRWSGEAAARLASALRGQRVVVHAQDPLNAGQIGMRLAKLMHAPLITHVHSPVFGTEVRDWLGRAVGTAIQPAAHAVVRQVAARVFASSARVIAVTEYVAGLLADRGFDRLEVLPCGIETPLADNAVSDVRRKLGIPPDSPLLLYVGRLEPDKGLEGLLLAFRHVLEALPTAVLLLVGGGALTSRYQGTAVRLGVSHRTVFAGWAAHAEVWSYYRQADLFVIANADEAQGLVALEAQACGLPVAGYKTGGIGLMVRDDVTGLLCDPNPQSLAENIVRLWVDRELRSRLGTNGPASAARFRADECFIALLRIYQETLS